VRKVLRVAAPTAVGMTLLSCTAQRQPVDYALPPPPVVYAPPAPVVHAPLPPPVGYASAPPPMINSPRPSAAYGNSPDARSEARTANHLVWRTSPRWAAVKGKAPTVVKQDPQAKFEAAKAKATKVGVENLSKDDVDGLNLAQLKELRGY
jgi:hypothetical protein